MSPTSFAPEVGYATEDVAVGPSGWAISCALKLSLISLELSSRALNVTAIVMTEAYDIETDRGQAELASRLLPQLTTDIVEGSRRQ